MNTISQQDEVISLIRNTIANSIEGKIKDYKFNTIKIEPLTQKYNVAIEVKFGNTIYPIHACKDTLNEVAKELIHDYEVKAYTYQLAQPLKAINAYFL